MGNSPSATEEAAGAPPPTANSVNDSTLVTTPDYQWPNNLYEESRDMAAASFLVYTFGYILETARNNPGAIAGLEVDSKRKMKKHSSSAAAASRSSAELARSFTPHEVAAIVKENAALLAESFPIEFKDPTAVERSLELLQQRVDDHASSIISKNSSNSNKNNLGRRPLTLREYDDKHQEHELVYAVAVDDINKRVTLVFRGTDNELSFYSNWTTNAYVAKTTVDLPDQLKGKVDFETVNLHSGFYNYLFSATFDDTDDPEKTKIDEIMDDVKPLLAANPDYKLYVTGHSLGAAMSGLVSFFLACDTDIPKPVTCINFASPRIGDWNYLNAVQVLEQTHQLRFCRLNNDKDSIAAIPMYNYYHAGFQVRLYKPEDATAAAAALLPPEITYPKVVDSPWNKWGRTWGNSLFASLNLAYDHGDYRERIEANRSALEAVSLNDLYENPELTGFSMMEAYSK